MLECYITLRSMAFSNTFLMGKMFSNRGATVRCFTPLASCLKCKTTENACLFLWQSNNEALGFLIRLKRVLLAF